MINKYTIKGIRWFNERKVIELTEQLLNNHSAVLNVEKKDSSPIGDETVLTSTTIKDHSSHSIIISQRKEGIVIVLPVRSSEEDIHLCYAFLYAVKKVYRTARIMDKNDICINLRNSDIDVQKLWDSHVTGQIEDGNELAALSEKNPHKTFIMRWNTDISNYKLCEFEEAMKDFENDGFYYDWSIWDYKDAHVGDKFYMLRSGKGKNGIVMCGTIIGAPYLDEDWSGRGRKVYYIRMRLSHMIHPDKSPLLLSTEELTKAIPEFNWEEGHSGEILDNSSALQLDGLWNEYVEKVHQMAEKEDAGYNFNAYYKEKGWRMTERHPKRGSNTAQPMELDEYLYNILPWMKGQIDQ